jgi:hypothetical protein
VAVDCRSGGYRQRNKRQALTALSNYNSLG